MSNIAFILINLVVLFILFVIDKGFHSISIITGYFSLSVFFLMVLLNLKLNSITPAVFFFFGFVVDLYSKTFLGISSLVSLFVFYMFKVVSVKFTGNRISLLGLNFISSYILFYVFNDYSRIVSFELFTFATISTLLLGVSWFIKNS
jgi:hypothetical protein